jgi:hypothetical protein
VKALTSTPGLLWQSGLIAGDFNLHHPSWDPDHPSPSKQAETLLNWLDLYSFTYTGVIRAPTHNQGNTLDLAFLTGPLTAYTASASHLDSTSDHSSLLTTVNWSTRNDEPVKRLKLDTLDRELFTDLLRTNLTLLPALEEIPLPLDLDQEAQGLSQALNRAYSGAAKRTTGRNTGHPWWDLDCKVVTSRNRNELLTESARNLRNTVRKAKNSY